MSKPLRGSCRRPAKERKTLREFYRTADGADISRATDLGRGAGVGRNADRTGVSRIVNWVCVSGVGQTTGSVSRVAD